MKSFVQESVSRFLPFWYKRSFLIVSICSGGSLWMLKSTELPPRTVHSWNESWRKPSICWNSAVPTVNKPFEPLCCGGTFQMMIPSDLGEGVWGAGWFNVRCIHKMLFDGCFIAIHFQDPPRHFMNQKTNVEPNGMNRNDGDMIWHSWNIHSSFISRSVVNVAFTLPEVKLRDVPDPYGDAKKKSAWSTNGRIWVKWKVNNWLWDLSLNRRT
jgi:hypothetical protein